MSIDTSDDPPGFLHDVAAVVGDGVALGPWRCTITVTRKTVVCGVGFGESWTPVNWSPEQPGHLWLSGDHEPLLEWRQWLYWHGSSEPHEGYRSAQIWAVAPGLMVEACALYRPSSGITAIRRTNPLDRPSGIAWLIRLHGLTLPFLKVALNSPFQEQVRKSGSIKLEPHLDDEEMGEVLERLLAEDEEARAAWTALTDPTSERGRVVHALINYLTSNGAGQQHYTWRHLDAAVEGRFVEHPSCPLL